MISTGLNRAEPSLKFSSGSKFLSTPLGKTASDPGCVYAPDKRALFSHIPEIGDTAETCIQKRLDNS